MSPDALRLLDVMAEPTKTADEIRNVLKRKAAALLGAFLAEAMESEQLPSRALHSTAMQLTHTMCI